MFLGRFEYSVDAKGRVPIPPRFRDAFRAGLVLVKGFDRDLAVYPQPDFEALAELNAALPTGDPATRNVLRWRYMNAETLNLDSQGRVLLPTELRTWAEIVATAHVIGNRDHLEIWNPAILREFEAQVDANPSELAAQVGARI